MVYTVQYYYRGWVMEFAPPPPQGYINSITKPMASIQDDSCAGEGTGDNVSLRPSRNDAIHIMLELQGSSVLDLNIKKRRGTCHPGACTNSPHDAPWKMHSQRPSSQFLHRS